MKKSGVLAYLFFVAWNATFSAASSVNRESEIIPVAGLKSSKDLAYGHRFSLDGVTKRTHMEKAKIAGRSDIMKSGRAPDTANHVVIFAIKNKNINKLESSLLDISNPNSKNYGKHLTQKEIAQLSANEAAQREIRKYFDYHDIKILKISRNKEYITAEAPISKWEEVFGNEFHLFKQSGGPEDGHLVRAEEYSLPDILAEHVEAVLNVVQFPGIFFV